MTLAALGTRSSGLFGLLIRDTFSVCYLQVGFWDKATGESFHPSLIKEVTKQKSECT